MGRLAFATPSVYFFIFFLLVAALTGTVTSFGRVYRVVGTLACGSRRHRTAMGQMAICSEKEGERSIGPDQTVQLFHGLPAAVPLRFLECLSTGRQTIMK